MSKIKEIQQYMRISHKMEREKGLTPKKTGEEKEATTISYKLKPKMNIKEIKPNVTIEEMEEVPKLDGHREVTIGNTIYYYGGGVHSTQYKKTDMFLKYNAIKQELETVNISLASSKPPPLIGHRLLRRRRREEKGIKETILLVGGSTNRGRTNAIWEYDIETTKWRYIECQMPEGIEFITGHIAHYHQKLDHLYVHGGLKNSENEYSEHMLRLDIKQQKWAIVPTQGPTPSKRGLHASVIHMDNYIFIFGGSESYTDDSKDMSDVWCYNIDKEQWSEIECTGSTPPPSTYSAHTLIGDYFYVHSGNTEKEKMLHRLNLLKNEWEYIAYEGTLPKHSNGATLAAVDIPSETTARPTVTQLILYGGSNSHDYQLNSMHAITFNDRDEDFMYLIKKDNFVDCVFHFSDEEEE